MNTSANAQNTDEVYQDIRSMMPGVTAQNYNIWTI